METKTILIVDDEEITRQGLKHTLEKWSKGKYEILCASDGPEAHAVMNKSKAHLVITDICMPEMTGLQLLQSLKSIGHRFVAIILSGHRDFEYAQEAIRLSVVNYLLKPVSKGKLIEAVEQALEVEANMEQAIHMEKVADQKLFKIDSSTVHSNSAIKEAISFISQNVNNPLTLKQVADAVHLNASYFSVLFKEHTRLTFSEYVTRKRLQLSKNLLLTTDDQIEEIAQKAGYRTAKYFIKIFKEYEGITPSKFRKMPEVEGINIQK